MKNWQVQVTLHRRPGAPVIMLGVAAETSGAAYGQALSRLGPAVYGADFKMTEIRPPQKRTRPA